MKNLKYISLIFITAIMFVGCGEDLSVETGDTNHRIVVTSEMDFENKVAIGGHIDFGDISRGVISRTWTVPDDANIARIQAEASNTSSKNVMKAFFYKPGQHNVTLKQTFGGDVYPNDDSVMPINGRELDTTIVVTVLDSLRANLKLHYINDDGSTGAELVLEDDAENELTASKSVRLTFTALGEPDNVIWTSNGGKPDRISTTLEEVDMRFNQLGTWDLDFLAQRTRPRDADTISFENIIKIIPSTDPVVLERVMERNGALALEFSRDMDPESLDAGDFTVRLENGGNTLNPMVAEAILDDNENNVVLLSFDGDRMYDNDVAYVSYTPGNMRTADLVDADAFTDYVSTTVGANPNFYESTGIDFGFENTTANNSGGGDWPYQFWGGNWGEYDIAINSDRPHTGSKSAFIELRSNGGMIMAANAKFNLVVGQEYEIGYWVYVVNGVATAPTGTAASDIRFYANNFAMGDWLISALTPSFPTGEWVYQKFYFKSSTDAEITWLIRGNNENHSNPITFYMDDLFLAEVELRP